MIERAYGVAARAATLALPVALVAAMGALTGCATTRVDEPAPLAPTLGARAENEAPPSPATASAAATTDPSELPATLVDASRVPVPSPDAPTRGPANAPVTIQIFSDFECPFCAMAAPVLRRLESEFGGSVRVVWHNYPLPMHPHSELAAATALEVYAERGGAAFWRFHDATFAAQRRGLSEAVLEGLAKDEGVDLERYHAALASHAYDARIQADLDAGDAAGVNGTPAFFVNRWFAVGALPYADMRAIVLQALKDAGR